MKKIKLITAFFLVLFVLTNLNAVSLDEILTSSKENSPSFQNIVLSYQSGLLTVSDLEEDDKTSIKVDITVDPLANLDSSGNSNPLAATEKGITINPTVSVTLPNDGNTTITTSGNLGARYDGKAISLSGEIGASHSFDFSPYNSNHSKDLTYTITKYSTDLTYKKAELNFEKSVISTISSILSMEKQIKTLENDYNKQKKNVEKIETLGTYSSSSSVYISAKNLLAQKEATLESTKEQYNNLLVSYKTISGLDWDGLDELDEPNLDLVTYNGGNTEVLITSLNAEKDEDSYNKAVAEENPSLLTTSLGVGVTSNTTVNVSASARYSAKNWNVTLAPSVSIKKDGETTPSLTISGSWKNDTGSSTSVKSSLYKAQSSNNDYLSALSSYNENVQAYTLKILDWNNSKASSKTNLEYLESVKENEEELFKLGLATQDDLDSAILNYENALIDWDILLLEGLSIERDLKIFAL